MIVVKMVCTCVLCVYAVGALGMLFLSGSLQIFDLHVHLQSRCSLGHFASSVHS